MDVQWMLFSFSGRINRAKWWLGSIILVVIAVILVFILAALMGLAMAALQTTTSGVLLSIILTVIFGYPATALMVKRLNDRDRPTWLAAVFWLPTILNYLGLLLGATVTMTDVGGQQVAMPTPLGWVISIAGFVIGIWALIELGILKGTRGPNKHGPDPLGQA